MSPVIWLTGGCYYRLLLKAGKFSCISGCMVDSRLLLLGDCCRQVRTVVSGSMVDMWL